MPLVKRQLLLLALTVALTLNACASRRESIRTMSIEALWKSTNKGDAFVDLRCQGLNPDAVWTILQPYHDLEQKLWVFRKPMPGDNDEIIPIHLGCRHYRGAFDRYKQHLKELDRRLSPQ